MKQDLFGQSSIVPTGIAIIGMAGRFPGAADVRAFWRNLRNDVESITRFADSELEDSFDQSVRDDPNFVRARAVLDGVEQFDAGFFGMHAREAELTDPQHRVFLECAWQALEDGGYDPASYSGAIGVFAGCSINTYFLRHVCQNRSVAELFASNYQVGGYAELIGALQDFLATRVSYKLDLRGPSVTVQSACSTSLVAVAQACQSLLLYQSDMALAGGVSISLPQRRGYLAQDGAMGSTGGRCRTFDAKADGTVFGSGAGVVLLKRLEDALADGDHVYAVIRGSAVNNDGAGKAGFTAPSANGQAQVIAAALADADVDPRTISYVECHGTATPLGDPIEVAGLTKAFRASTDDVGFCALGSVKPNVGHLDAAAGVTGLIKTALALSEAKLPPTLFFETPNPHIAFDGSPFYVDTIWRDWPRAAWPRRAGVSAFGVGGTNAHLVLEEPPAIAPEGSLRPTQVIVVSARSEAALEAARQALGRHIKAHPELALADVAFTQQVGRRAFAHRAAVAYRDRDAVVDALVSGRGLISGRPRAAPPPIAFMFPGQGAQYPGMGIDLFETEPVFRASMRRSAEILKPLLGRDLCALLYGDEEERLDAEALQATEFAQPALFAVAYALAGLWRSWGVEPQTMIGHSVGEFVAACLAGVFSQEDALALIAARGRLMQEMPPGAMLAVRLPEAELAPLLSGSLALAAVNGPSLCVAAGPDEAVAELDARLAARGVISRLLHTSHAFHTPMMDAAAAALEEQFAQIQLSAPTIPCISSVTGGWLTEAQATSPAYWATHCRAPVRFGDGLSTLLRDAAVDGRAPVLIEAGPGLTLSTLARQGGAGTGANAVLGSLPDASRPAADDEVMARSAAQLWCAGVAMNWPGVHAGAGRLRVPLPTYPFERSRHWIDAPPPARDDGGEAGPFQSGPVQLNSAIETFAAETPATETPSAETFSAMQSAPAAKVRSDAAPAQTGRAAELQDRIVALLETLSGEPIAAPSLETSFLEMGFDSLFLSQVTQQLQRDFKVKLTFRQLLGEASTIPALAAFLAAKLPPEPIPTAPSPAPAALASARAVVLPPTTSSPLARMDHSGAEAGAVERVIRDQLDAMSRLMQQQLEALRGSGALPVVEPQPAPTAAAPLARPTAQPAAAFSTPEPEQGKSRFETLAEARNAPAAPMTEAQKQNLAALIARVNARTPQSKILTEQYRHVLADPRAAAGFRQEWKDLVYPIVGDRAAGSCIWDVDGNAYIDVVNGYGQTMFGHAPPFVVEAVEAQLRQGFAIGPQATLAGRVAALFGELTGDERVTFCNTGSEAVMAAMRVARTVTGRSRIATFTGDYHGQFDEVLVKGSLRAGVARPMAAAAGIPQESVENMVVLPYGAPESLEWIRAHADELAAVLVEPVQSRHPDLQPAAFVKEIRAITEAAGVALIIDEVITGFRMHQGGMQALFGVRADLATYGKVIGGGLPIGVLAGKAAFMDALDGGMWRYGDDSYPEVGVTFFAGTFVRHPLVLAAMWAVLNHMKEQGPALQEGLTARTAALVRRLNSFLQGRGVDVHIETCGSLFYFSLSNVSRFAGLFYPHMLERGVYIQDHYPCFLTTAHSDADLAAVAEAFESSIIAMQDAGFLPGGPSGPEPSGSNAPVTDAPLTEAQTEVWLAAQLSDEASCAFNESVTLRLRGALDRAALATALNQVVARHDALRGSFDPTGDLMRIASALEVTIAERSLEAVPSAEAEAAWQALLAAEAETPFDLANGPLIRAQLVRWAPEDHALILTMHHIVCDGWSMNVVIDELAKFYDAMRSGVAADLPPPVGFARYGAEERARQAQQGAALEAFWLPQFASPPPPVDLPTDRPRQPAKTFRGATFTRMIDAATTQRFRKAAARQGCTLFVGLLAAFETLLGRLAGQEEVVVGVPAAGQTLLVEEGSLVGHCVNFLPLRGSWGATTTLAEHLAATRQTVLAAYENQSFTLGTLVRKLALPRGAGQRPLVEAAFNLERLGDGVQMAGLKVETQPNPKRFVNFDLFFNFTEQDGGLRVDCDYDADLFDASTIERWIGHYRTLLDAMARDITDCGGSRPAATLSLLTEEERAFLINGSNRSPPRALDLRPVHEVFAGQAERTPDSVALLCDDAELTYRQLDLRSNQFARRLRTLGVRPGDRAGLLVQRSTDAIVALLGVLKAGGAYVPLDPSYPPELLAFMLKDCAPALTLGQRDLVSTFKLDDCPAVELEAALEASLSESEDALDVQRDAGDLAYVMYTSGSTGRPKGVMVPHRAIVRLVQDQDYARFAPDETFLHLAPLAFDAGTFEIWGALLNGARLGIICEARPSLDEIGEAIARYRATTAWFTAGLFHELVDHRLADLRPLRQILAGGDVLSPANIEKALAGLPDVQLINGYGPTENTTFTCCYRIPREGSGGGPVPIGTPIGRTDVYILGPDLEPVPIGVVGQICVGGDGLALGYLNRPDLTLEKFIPNPFSETSEDRLYLTGDMARRRPDGVIEFFGRRDRQVKINGKRVELDEIENVLRADPRVADAVVTREDGGTKRAIAYLKLAIPAPESERDSLGKEVIAALRAKLPDHMIPSAVVTLDAFPLTPNGKVDRKAMPAPGARLESFRHVAPRTPAEAALASIWADALKLDYIGAYDNFFDLGGDAVQAVKVAARASQSGLRLTIGQIYERPRLADLAAIVGEAAVAPAEQGVVQGEVPLTPIQQWFFETEPAEPHHFNQSFLLECRKKLSPALLQKAIAHWLVLHDALRLRFERTAQGWRQHEAGLDAETPFEIIDLSGLGPAEQDMALERVADRLQRSLGLARGPLLRVALFELGGARGQRLLVIIHHLAVDMVSWGILLEDLRTAYERLEKGLPVQLPAKTTSFKSWAEQLKAYAASPEAQSQAEYWRGLPWSKVAPLPVDKSEADNTAGSSASIVVGLSAEETRALLRETPRAYRTQINDVLLTALAQAFAGWTGRDSLFIGLEGHGREDLIPGADLSRTTGWFTSLFPAVLDISGARNPGEALEAVKKQLRAVPQRGVGYGILRYMGGEAALAALPEPEVWFNYLGEWDDGLADTPWFGLASEGFGTAISPKSERRRLIDINGWVVGGCLQLDWSYSSSRYEAWTVQALAENFIQNLRRLIAHCGACEAGSAVSDPSLAPWTPVEAALALIWADVLKVERVGPHDNFFELGGHSLLAMRLVARVASAFNVKIRIMAFFQAPTLREFAALVTSLQAPKEAANHVRVQPEAEKTNVAAFSPAVKAPKEPADIFQVRPEGVRANVSALSPAVEAPKEATFIVPIQPAGEKTPIIAIHNTMMYYSLAGKIGTDRPFFGIKLFDPGEPLHLPTGSMTEIAADYVRAIRAAQPHGPYILVGLCTAGVIAYEAARQLRQAGESVPLVVVADTSAPGFEQGLPFAKRLFVNCINYMHVLRHRLGLIRSGKPTIAEVLATFTVVRLSRILDLALWLGLIGPTQQGQDDRETWLVLRALEDADRRFTGFPSAGDLVVFQSDQVITRFIGPSMGWSDLVRGRIFIHRIPGWHEGIFQNEGPGLIAEYLRPLLEEVDAQRGRPAPPAGASASGRFDPASLAYRRA